LLTLGEVVFDGPADVLPLEQPLPIEPIDVNNAARQMVG